LVKGESFGVTKFWALILYDNRYYILIYFIKSKNQLKTKTELVEGLMEKETFVKFLKFDDDAEKASIKRTNNERHFGIKFEFSFKDTTEEWESQEKLSDFILTRKKS
jgi:hypothetical protein